MNSKHFFAAAFLSIAGAASFAAESAAVATAATASAVGTTLDGKTFQQAAAPVSKGGARSAAERHAEVVEHVKNYKTTFEEYLDQFKG